MSRYTEDSERSDYTEDMVDILSCYRERNEVRKILNAWCDHGLPWGMEDDEVNFGYNKNSGNVFIFNADYVTALMNGRKLEIFYTCPECGTEGFLEDMEDETDLEPDKHQCCKDYLLECGAIEAEPFIE